MKAPNNSVYIDKEYKNVATIGELYLVSYFCLQGINHLEALSGEFPVGYELAITRIWPYDENKKIEFPLSENIYAFYFRRKNKPVKIITGDFNDDFDTFDELKDFITHNDNITTEEVVKHMLIKMSIWDYE